MKNLATSFLVGVLFSIGLGISGMTQPQKVVGFLDILGSWNPSLIFVMMGAIFVHAIAYIFIMKRSKPRFSASWHLPKNNSISPSLIFGSLIFGVGWALAGYCPGPALTSLASFTTTPYLFVGSMIAGMILFRVKTLMIDVLTTFYRRQKLTPS